MKNKFKLLFILLLLLTIGVQNLYECNIWNINSDIYKAKNQKEMKKEATDLDKYFTSNIKLTLPELDKSNSYDIVFALDMSEIEKSTTDKYIELIDSLQRQIEGKDIHVKVAFTIFKGVSVSSNWYDLSEYSYEQIKNEVTNLKNQLKNMNKGGTNMPSALIQAKELLDSDVNVIDPNKYLFFVTDGIGFEFCNQDLTNAYNQKKGTNYKMSEMGFTLTQNASASTEDSKVLKIGDHSAESWTNQQWEDYFDWVENNYKPFLKYSYNYHDISTFTVEGKLSITEGKPVPGNDMVPLGVDIDVYQTNYYFNQIAKKYRTYAIPLATDSSFYWGPAFMNYLARNNKTDVNEIMNELFLNINDGISKKIVLDEMGKTEQYEFDVINELKEYNVFLNDIPMKKTKINDNYYVFGDYYVYKGVGQYPVTVEYISDNGSNNEQLIWTVNMSLANYDKAQLAYKVKLRNPESVLDKTGLLTNNKAVLKAYDEHNNLVYDKEFNKPKIEESNKLLPEEPTPDENPNTLDSIWIWFILAICPIASMMSLIIYIKKFNLND